MRAAGWQAPGFMPESNETTWNPHRIPTQELAGFVWDADPIIRAETSAILGSRGVPTTAVYLHEIFEDEDATVRLKVVEALILIWGPGTIHFLGRARRDPIAEISDLAAQAMRNRRGQLGIATLSHPNPDILNPADDEPGSLGASGVGERAIDLLDLNSSDPALRIRTARSLARNPLPAAVRGLVEHMDDEEAPVREACARALGRLRAGLPELVFALRDDYQSVRMAATGALASLQEDKVYEEMWEAALSWVPGSPGLLQAFDDIGEDVHPLLEDWIEHPFAGVRGVAVDWVGEHPAADLVDLLRPILEDEVPWLREEADSIFQPT